MVVWKVIDPFCACNTRTLFAYPWLLFFYSVSNFAQKVKSLYPQNIFFSPRPILSLVVTFTNTYFWLLPLYNVVCSDYPSLRSLLIQSEAMRGVSIIGNDIDRVKTKRRIQILFSSFIFVLISKYLMKLKFSEKTNNTNTAFCLDGPPGGTSCQ